MKVAAWKDKKGNTWNSVKVRELPDELQEAYAKIKEARDAFIDLFTATLEDVTPPNKQAAVMLKYDNVSFRFEQAEPEVEAADRPPIPDYMK